MGVHTLVGELNGEDAAAFVCSSTGRAFGPVMASSEEAEAFLQWLPGDARDFDDLRPWLDKFRTIWSEEAHTKIEAKHHVARLFSDGTATVTTLRASLAAPVWRVRYEVSGGRAWFDANAEVVLGAGVIADIEAASEDVVL